MSDFNEKRKQILAYVARMPSLPVTMTKVIKLCNDPKASPTDLNKVISMDPVLMGKVLKLINSAYYGMNKEVNSLVRAIIMLGLNTIKNLALSSAVLTKLHDSNHFHALGMDDFWQHSLSVAVISKYIAKHRKVGSKYLEDYFVAGLLHDIGKIPLNAILSKEYSEVLKYAEEMKIPLCVSEEKFIDMPHTDVGTLIVKHWQLNEQIEHPVFYHHSVDSYDGPYQDLVFTVALSNQIADISGLGFSGDSYPGDISVSLMEELGIKPDFLQKIKTDVDEQIEKAKIFLNM